MPKMLEIAFVDLYNFLLAAYHPKLLILIVFLYSLFSFLFPFHHFVLYPFSSQSLEMFDTFSSNLQCLFVFILSISSFLFCSVFLLFFFHFFDLFVFVCSSSASIFLFLFWPPFEFWFLFRSFRLFCNLSFLCQIPFLSTFYFGGGIFSAKL